MDINEIPVNAPRKSSNSIFGVLIFGLMTAIAWQFPEGRLALYPFTLLGTWFHEMSHGIAALILGGNFHQLQISSDASGVALISGSLFLGPFGSAIVAGAGPMGPAIAGAVLLILTSIPKRAKAVLLILALFMLLSVVIWVRSWTGAILLTAFSVLLSIIAIYGKDKLALVTVQLFSVQAFMSVFLSIDYLFSAGAVTQEGRMLSDTAVIEQNLLLPYWFWGAVLLVASMIILLFSVRYILKKS